MPFGVSIGARPLPNIRLRRLGDPGLAREVDAELASFGGAMIRRMAVYPPQVPPIGSRQSIGGRGNPRAKRRYIRRGYRRTGRLGRNWRIRGQRPGYIRVGNNVYYSVFVQGPLPGEPGRRQTAIMTERGWVSITTAVNAEWPAHRDRLRFLLDARGPRPVL